MERTLMKVGVIGIGGVGGYFGGKLARAFQGQAHPSVEVHFVARGHHLEVIRKKGLTLKTSDQGALTCKPVLAADRLEDLPNIDVFVVAVKGYDLDEVSRKLTSRVSEETIILPLLNGVDIRERMRRHLRNGIILPACVYLGSYIEEPGVVTQTGKPGRMILGPDPEKASRPVELLKVFEEASILHEWTPSVMAALWEKFVFIAGYGLVSARFNKALGEIYEDDSLRNLTREIMEEISRIASAKRVALPQDIVDASIKKASLFSRDTQTSLQRDIHGKRGRSELDLFGGTVVEQGKALRVPTPVTERIYAELLKNMPGPTR
jgi:2-dehydropantoate 2-reductase